MEGLPLPPSTSPSPSSSPTGMRMRPPPSPNPMGIGSNFNTNFNNNPTPTNQQQQDDEKMKKKKRLPSPKELIGYYESQGMSSEEASIKVIDDLQNVVFRVVSSRSGKTTSLDVINSRLMKLEAKLDSKPGYAQILAIGVVSGAVFQGIGHVASAFAQIWNSVSNATTTKP